MQYETIEVEPLSPMIGAEISGVDLSRPLGNQTFQEIHDALLRHLVIFFRDQNIDLEQQKAFGRRFGKLHIHPTAPSAPGHPEVLVVKADANSKAVAGNRWHTDVSCDVEPPMGSILHMRELPASGGDTMFANMYAAYEALSQPMQAFLSGLKAWHESEHVLGGTLGQKRHDGERSIRAPCIRSCARTRRRAASVSTSIPGSRRGSRVSARRRAAPSSTCCSITCARPSSSAASAGSENSVAFWDNRSAQHYALWDYFPHSRLGYRVTICGTRPV